MKVSAFYGARGEPSEEYLEALAKQNGKKTIARRAAAMKGSLSKRKRRKAARNS